LRGERHSLVSFFRRTPLRSFHPFTHPLSLPPVRRHLVSFVVRRSSFVVRRSSFVVRRSSCVVRRPPTKRCCWWGRGSIRLRGTCNYGKLNYFLGKRAHDEGRPSLYPDIDFCANPQAVCSERDRHPDLPWIAGLFRWVTEVQPYDGDGFDYVMRLRDFVDGGLRDGSFPLAVSGIVAAGCHAPPCAGGRGGAGDRPFDGSDRTATFARALRLFGFPAEFDTAA
jgi:hypothetical protein